MRLGLRFKKFDVHVPHRDKVMLFTHVVFSMSNYGTERLQFMTLVRLNIWHVLCSSWFHQLKTTDARIRCNAELLPEVAICLLIIHKQDPRRAHLPGNFWAVMWGIMKKGREKRGEAARITMHTGYYRCHQAGIPKAFEAFHTYAVLGMLFGVIRNIDR